MIIVTGTKRSGTSLWMHLLVRAGLPSIGDRFPRGFGDLLHEANPDGFFESELVAGVNFQTNPHPLTGAYLSPEQTRRHAVKIFIAGLIRTDVAFIDHCIATVRSWRDYVASARRMQALVERGGGSQPEDAILPPALEWWRLNFGLVRDLAIRRYPVHVLSYDGLLREPERHVREVLQWIGLPEAETPVDVVRPPEGSELPETSDDLAEGLDPRHIEVFDEFFDAIDRERDLTDAFIERLNETDQELRPMLLQYQARVDANTIANMIGKG
jgi:hypothetical protein